jgi:hypothetical protein
MRFQEYTMRGKLMAFSLGVFCSAGAAAEDAPQPQPVASGGAVAAAKAHAQPLARIVASPVVMETSAEIGPDGELTLNCKQKRNPHPVAVGPARPAPVPQQ